MEMFKVSSKSKPQAVAGAIGAALREKGSVGLQAIGAGALNQAVKAVAISRGFLAPQGYDIVMIPAFVDVEVETEQRTAIRLLVQPRRRYKK